VGPRAGLYTVSKKKIPNTRRESNPYRPDRPARSLVAIPTELSRLFFAVLSADTNLQSFRHNT
jgi:hypothetical protein